MKKRDILPAWGRILNGRRPFLSIEITKECPLRCPGCYVYASQRFGDGKTLHGLREYRGEELISKTLELVRRLRPIHVSIVGGEPLVRYRELDAILQELERMRIEVQLVTSAVRRIPEHWTAYQNLHLVVSIDGLAPEHDKRRSPATYSRILGNIAGHRIIVHCTITKQLTGRKGYFSEFCDYWSARPEVHTIWFSLYTPQEGEDSKERLTPQERMDVIEDLSRIRSAYPKLYLPDPVIRGFARPPRSPQECIFPQVTTAVSADLDTRITPCQLGGHPVCSKCGCIAAAGLFAIGNYRLGGLIPLWAVFALSRKLGGFLGRRRPVAANGSLSTDPVVDKEFTLWHT
jgi:MoaA/NifB/PqqE/SkfB family radical SAM enzyme